ncbi:MAG: substrate-binding domain-containing protein [Clostridiales bacterium]|nr:substrate-binding domain-containing protein [Clostridiales bacterium]
MKVINKILPLLMMCLAATSCAAVSGTPDSALSELKAVSREEGSGTRTEFESLLATDGTGTDIIAVSTDDVIKTVAEDEKAIGYIAYSSLADNLAIKAVSVDGIYPDSESVKNGKYPLCRNYFIAYSSSLNPAEEDFITYILSAGQEIVAEYVLPVEENATFLSDKSAGTIKIAGSSSAAPVVSALTEAYKSYNPNAEITVEVSDSTQGLTDAMRGECDIAISSRNLKDYEEELLTKKAIARDAIAVIVNENSSIEDLSSAQIKKIYNNTF